MHAVHYFRRRQLYYDRNYSSTKFRPRLNEKRLKLSDTLPVHSGCVNTIAWDDQGRYLLSGSDDRTLVISDPFAAAASSSSSSSVLTRIATGHGGNIFSAKFFPATAETVVSCASDGSVIVNDVEICGGNPNSPHPGALLNWYKFNGGAVYEVCPTTYASSFVTCSEDGAIRRIDRRQRPHNQTDQTDQRDVIVRCQCAVNAVDVGLFRPYLLAAGCSDSTVRLYDLRRVNNGAGQSGEEKDVLGLRSCFVSPTASAAASSNADGGRQGRVTSVEISKEPGDDHVIASVSSDAVYCFSLTDLAGSEEKVSLYEVSSSGLLDGGHHPPQQCALRKVRLRGDWTDTGPRSRPSTSANDHQEASASAAIPSTGDQEIGGDPRGGSVDAAEDESNAGIGRISRALTGLFSSRRQQQEQQEQESTSSGAADMTQAQKIREDCRGRILEEARRRRDERRRELAQALDAVPQHRVSNAYWGHRNSRTVLKQASFWGRDHIVSGSDCGHVFIWERASGRVSNILEADRHVVNCVQPHSDMFLLATSGIDYDIKLWAPLEPEEVDRSDAMAQLIERNKVMIEETRDTVTVPAVFMLRMLAAMNRYRRRDRRGDQQQEAAEPDDDQEGDADSSDSA